MFRSGATGARHLQALAGEPRPAGSEQAARGRAYCAAELAALGFDVQERGFEYSALPGRFGTPLGGLAALLVVVGAGCMLGESRPGVALAILLVGVVAVGAGGLWLGRRGILSLPVLRRRGVNLEAVRAGQPPALWLVAHIDSKSQPISLLGRAVGVIVLAASWIAAALIASGQLWRGAADGGAWPWIAIAAVIGALPVIASTVGEASDGAVDNASGVATVLSAVAVLSADTPVGVLITDAEEMGLAGARAWCNQRPAGTVLNCDGVDDDGPLTLMYTRPRPRRLEAALRRAANEARVPVRAIPLIPGVLVDGVAFSDAGWEVITLSRGTFHTLRRVHRPGDDLSAMRGDGIVSAAQVLARAAADLAARNSSN